MTALTKPFQPTRSKIDMRDGMQARAWAKKLDISPAQLQKLVETVGNSAIEVRKEIGRLGARQRMPPDSREKEV